jgi:DNA polymerase III epsilon subunit-like protein
MNWWERPIVALDVETTGLDRYGGDSLCRLTLIAVNPAGEIVGSKLDEYIVPRTKISDGALKVHQLTKSFLEENGKPDFEVLKAASEMLSTAIEKDFPVCVFNALFDIPFLISSLRRVELDPLPAFSVIDPWLIMRHMSREWYSLDKAAQEVLGESQPHPHNSLWDAQASARIVFRLAETHPRFFEIPMEWLRERQQVWALKYVRECAAGEEDNSYAWPRGKYANLEPAIQPGLFEDNPYEGEE